MEAKDLVVNPTNNTVSASSMWTFKVDLEFPLAEKCLVRILFPDDISYLLTSVQGTGFF
jgi:hypothetical protein